MSSPDGHTVNSTNNDTSLQITNSGKGVTSPDNTHYKNTLIGWNMPTDPGNRNTIIGSAAGELATGDMNTYLGYESHSSSAAGDQNTMVGGQSGKNSSGTYNAFLGMSSGFHITSAGNNICIGPQTGPPSSHSLLTTNGQLYIDTSSNNNGYKGSDSLIYGDQSGTGNILNFNAIVGIQDEAGSGSGEIRLYDDGGTAGLDYVGIKAPSDIADNAHYTLTLYFLLFIYIYA